MAKEPRIENLASARMRRIVDPTGHRKQAEENIVRLSMNPLTPVVHDHGNSEEMWWAAVALLRTATNFVLNDSDVNAVLSSFYDDAVRDDFGNVRTGLYDDARHYADTASPHPYDFIDLPPLPFPRMSLETLHEETGRTVSFWGNTIERDGHRQKHGHHLILINEAETGKWWDIYMPTDPASDPTSDHYNGPLMFDFRMGSQGRFWMPASDMQPDNPDKFEPVGMDITEKEKPTTARFWRRLILDLVTIVTADNVPRETIAVPRGHRRGFERTYGFHIPSLYWVRLDQAGEVRRGGSDREYHVRWLVRGHWRHHEHGSSICQNCGRAASWVRSHVKGPVGAPWKGRPVYAGNPDCSKDRETDKLTAAVAE